MSGPHDSRAIVSVAGTGHRALRYRHKKDKYTERKMLQRREQSMERFGQTFNALDPIDVEALKCRLMMLDSWERERVKFTEEELNEIRSLNTTVRPGEPEERHPEHGGAGKWK